MPKITPEMETLDEHLQRLTEPGILYRKRADGKLQCFACGHRCVIGEGRRGICQVRYNEGGRLQVPFGYVGGIQVDPIEKKPFFHALPGTDALSFGMLGCDFHCGYCQNWLTSQALRDPVAGVEPQAITPQELVSLARQEKAHTIVSTYNEPLITSEWAVAVFEEAHKQGLHTAYVSNGNATPEVLDFIRPYTNFYKIDLKSFNDKHYRELGGVLDNILESIQGVYERGMWLELVTLIVPNFNDSDAELKQMAQFIAGISADIPWHVTAFHADYKMSDRPDTQADTLLRAYEIGREAGLNFVYCGNRPGHVGDHENTYCPQCHALLVERYSFNVRQIRIANESCPDCGTRIPGVWELPAQLDAAHGIPRVVGLRGAGGRP